MLIGFVVSYCSNLHPFSSGTNCMRLNSRTLENLEIFKNQVCMACGWISIIDICIFTWY